MKASKHKPINEQIYAEASIWLVEFRSGDIDAAGRKEFYEWLRTSPEHIRAYLELAAIWNEGHALGQQRSFEDEAVAAALEASSNVVPLTVAPLTVIPLTVASGADHFGARPEAGREPSKPAARVWTQMRVAAAACFLLVVLGVSTGFWYSNRGVYTTGIGEQHRLTLRDGSVVQLNAESRIRVRYRSGQRDIDLLAGQAFFKVAHDPARPFVVHAASSQVRAVGTQFDVYLKTSATTVTVVEGVVALLPTSAERAGAAPADDSLLTAGEQAIVTAQSTDRKIVPDIADATAWTRGHLVFRGTSLEDVATEFNRYNTRRIVIRGEGLDTFKVSGMFSSTDPSSLLRFLAARPEIQVRETTDEISITHNPSAH